MLEVWGRRNASNVLPVMWAIGEMNIPHVRHDVGGSFDGLDRPEYRAMNPNGRIPTINDDGFVLWESNAVIRYLCRRYCNGSLLPDTDQEYAIADQWMEWHKSTAYPHYIDLFWAIVRTEPDLRDAERIAALAQSVGTALQRLDAHLADKTYIVGDRLTMADIPYGPLAHRYFQLDVGRPDLPNLKMWYELLRMRPAYETHVMFEYGTKPAEWYLHERGLPVEG